MALALTLGILAFGLPSPLFGIIVDRFGPRITLIVGNLLAAIGIFGIYLVQEVWHLYLLYILIGLGGGFGGYVASTTVINNWFIRRRSLALGIFIAGSGLGGFVFPPLATVLISAIDWRMTWLVLGGMISVISVTIGATILVRNRPEDMGLLPDGMTTDAFAEIETVNMPSKTEQVRVGQNIRQVLRHPTAWLLGAFAASNAFVMGTMWTHQIAYVRDIGYSPVTAATTMSFMSIFSLMSSLGFGALAMKFKVRYLASAAFVFQLMGLTILLNTRELGLIYVYAACLGISHGSLITALPTFVGAYYPRDRYAQVIGVVFPFQIISQAVAGTIAGAIYDATSTYTPAFITAAFFSLAGLIFVFSAREPRQLQPDNR